MPASHHTAMTGHAATGTALPVAFFHLETSTAPAGEPRSGITVTCTAPRLSYAAISLSHGASRAFVLPTWKILLACLCPDHHTLMVLHMLNARLPGL